MKKYFLRLLIFSFLFGISKLNASETSPQFINGNDTLVVYKSIPNLPEFMPRVEASEKQDIRTVSDKYTIRVRSAATSNEWVDVLALYTYNRAVEIPDMNQTNGSNSTTSVQHYPNATAGWSQTYGNIEMSYNQLVEVEIAPKNGFKIKNKDFFKATVHPSQKASAATVVNGKVYFTIRNPAQVAIDINGLMDDHNAFINPIGVPTDGVSSKTIPLHTITFFANPVIKKPALNDSRTFYVVDGKMPTVGPSTYDVLYFMPGVHDIGLNNKIYPGKSVYIPGDAIIFGSITNDGVPYTGFSKAGERIKIFGYGTISGARTKHPSYVTNPGIREPINIDGALNYQVTGITVADPAHFSVWTPGGSGGFVSYVKVVGWRANGDGLGNGDNVNDCFVRTNDDCSYVRGNRKRVTYWKDNISAIFYMSQIWQTTPILIEDCDVLYCRSRGGGGAAWDMRADAPAGQRPAKVTFRNIRFHDPISNMTIFNLITYKGTADAPTQVGGNYNWIKFENISIKTSSVKSNLLGCAAAPWNGGLTFDNVTFGGTTLTKENFSTYFNTNEYVKDIVFTTPIKYTISVNVSGAGGSVKGGGTFSPSQTAKLSATTAPNYKFENWTEGSTVVSTDSIYIFTISASRNLTANFLSLAGPKYAVITSANHSSPGTITGDGEYIDGQLVSVSANANNCYDFENWTENDVVVSTDSIYSFRITGKRNLKANFSEKTYTVTAVTSAGGSVSGDLTYTCNQVINVTATPNADYKFDGWYANNNLISTKLTDRINTGNSLQITAKFSSNATAVTTLAEWVSGNTNNKVDGSNRLMVVMVMGEHNTSTFSATDVTYGGQTMTKITERVHGTGYRTYAALFILNETGVNAASSGTIDLTWSSTPGGFNIYSVLLSNVDQTTPVSAFANNSLDGLSVTTSDLSAASGDMVIMSGSTATNTTITFNNGFTKQFESNANWGDGVAGSKPGTGINETPGFTQSASGRMVLCAMVVKKSSVVIPTYSIIALANSSNGGAISGGNKYTEGQSATLKATASSGYQFDNWSENGAIVSTNSTYSFAVKGDRNLVANFSVLPSYSISVSANPSIGGSTTGGGTYYSGQSITVNASAASGYQFVNWTENGTSVSTNSSFTFTASANRTLVANFTEIPTYQITATANPTIGGTVSGGGSFKSGQSATVTATASSGYTFANWTENGTTVSTNSSFTFTASANRTLVANFTEIPTYQITATANPTIGGTTSGGGYFNSGQTTTITASPSAGYKFDNWTENGISVSTNPAYAITVSGARTLVANFSINTNVSQELDNLTFNVYPNPATDIINIDINYIGMNKEIKLINNLGQVVYSNITKETTVLVNLKTLNIRGLVLVQVMTGKNLYYKKLLVR